MSSYYTKSEIRPGMYMTLDATGVDPVYVKRSTPPRPPRYGDPDPEPYSEVNQKLEQVRLKLNQLRKDLRTAREKQK